MAGIVIDLVKSAARPVVVSASSMIVMVHVTVSPLRTWLFVLAPTQAIVDADEGTPITFVVTLAGTRALLVAVVASTVNASSAFRGAVDVNSKTDFAFVDAPVSVMDVTLVPPVTVPVLKFDVKPDVAAVPVWAWIVHTTSSPMRTTGWVSVFRVTLPLHAIFDFSSGWPRTTNVSGAAKSAPAELPSATLPVIVTVAPTVAPEKSLTSNTISVPDLPVLISLVPVPTSYVPTLATGFG